MLTPAALLASWSSAVLLAMPHFGHGGHGYGSGTGLGGGLGDVFTTMAHAAIWTTVGRLLYRAPVLVLVVAFAGAAVWLVARRRRRGGVGRG